MRAFVITGPHAGEVREVTVREPQAGEAVVKVAYVGICGTDHHIFDGDLGSRYPLVPGHESSGTVAAVGADRGAWREGDRVAVDPVLSCGHCHACRRGRTNHCETGASLGDPMNGALAEYVRVPVRNLYRVEDHEQLDEAALTEPLACVVWGIERLRVRPADRALVFGAGPIGALMAQMLHLAGAADVAVVDIAEEKLAVTRELGASATYIVDNDLGTRLHERSTGRGFDVVVDCTGIASVIEGLFAHAAAGARIMFFGVASPSAEIRVRPYDIYRSDWEIIGSMAINGTFQQARDLLAAGRITVRPLITRVCGLDDVAGILGRAKAPADLKILVRPADG
jgi:2-desacetyl-2-hydroxyethyl bacteriochlorophyllide A dehydrogenase